MTRRRLDRVLNVGEVRDLARRRLPRIVFDAIEGGSGDEASVLGNREAFQRLWFRPRALADVSTRDLATTVLGQAVSMPLLLAPCGMARLAHAEAELGAVRAAGSAGTLFAVSAAASQPLEAIAAGATGPLWYQLYLPAARSDAEALVERAAAAGYGVLCVNIDSPVSPKRERDYRNGLTIPLRVTPRLIAAGISRPAWSAGFLTGKTGRGGDNSFYSLRSAYQRLTTTIADFHPVTFEDLEWLRERWAGQLVVKGVQRGDECGRMVDAGVDGIVVSNHGGRNLDGAQATLDALPEVVTAVDGRAEVFLDGGIRRGGDVVKALALGARACFIGRPYLYGLAVAGGEGVRHVLELLRAEIDSTMALLGVASVAELDATVLARGEPGALHPLERPRL